MCTKVSHHLNFVKEAIHEKPHTLRANCHSKNSFTLPIPKCQTPCVPPCKTPVYRSVRAPPTHVLDPPCTPPCQTPCTISVQDPLAGPPCQIPVSDPCVRSPCLTPVLDPCVRIRDLNGEWRENGAGSLQLGDVWSSRPPSCHYTGVRDPQARNAKL